MSAPIDRRSVLRGSGIGACALALAACSADQTESAEPESGVVLVQLADIPVGQGTVVTTDDGSAVAVVRSGEQDVHAFSAICTHQGCTVQANQQQFQCPCHGSQFAFQDGSVEHGPAEESLPKIEVTIQDGAVVTA